MKAEHPSEWQPDEIKCHHIGACSEELLAQTCIAADSSVYLSTTTTTTTTTTTATTTATATTTTATTATTSTTMIHVDSTYALPAPRNTPEATATSQHRMVIK